MARLAQLQQPCPGSQSLPCSADTRRPRTSPHEAPGTLLRAPSVSAARIAPKQQKGGVQSLHSETSRAHSEYQSTIRKKSTLQKQSKLRKAEPTQKSRAHSESRAPTSTARTAFHECQTRCEITAPVAYLRRTRMRWQTSWCQLPQQKSSAPQAPRSQASPSVASGEGVRSGVLQGQQGQQPRLSRRL